MAAQRADAKAAQAAAVEAGDDPDAIPLPKRKQKRGSLPLKEAARMAVSSLFLF
jgi:hypothetical protein